MVLLASTDLTPEKIDGLRKRHQPYDLEDGGLPVCAAHPHDMRPHADCEVVLLLGALEEAKDHIRNCETAVNINHNEAERLERERDELRRTLSIMRRMIRTYGGRDAGTMLNDLDNIAHDAIKPKERG